MTPCHHYQVKIIIRSSGLYSDLGCDNIYGLLAKREVKMAGYWPSSFFARLWTETKSRSINTQKKKRGQYPAILTEQAWSIKDLLYDFFRVLKRKPVACTFNGAR